MAWFYGYIRRHDDQESMKQKVLPPLGVAESDCRKT